MLTELFPDLYKIDIPLPQNPLKALNCYVFRGKGRTLIVDTGMNRVECLDVIKSGLAKLGVDPGKADYFITHMHVDHSGLISNLAGENSVVYCSEADAEIINADEAIWDKMDEFIRLGGFPASEFRDAIEKHPGYKYREREQINFTIIGDGDFIQAGGYRLNCVATPGHTKGHICLYEPDRKILLSGDHLLNDITPNISLWSDDLDPLNEYMKSLDKIAELDVDVVLPGHRRIITNCRKRIEELKLHHRDRAEEVLTILAEGCKNAFGVASRMTWDLSYESWELFPVAQKWFASGEALAHIKYLEMQGMIQRKFNGNQTLFCLR